jgi:sugar phosphate isomerase/epimerase
MRSAITISMVQEMAGGPFVFWHHLEGSCARARELGFDAMEIFVGGPDEFDRGLLANALAKHNLALAAFGTGAGWVKHKLSLTSADPQVRQRAKDFISKMIDRAAEFGCPAILGSMQGRIENGATRPEVIHLMRDALNELGAKAKSRGQVLLLEPLNRYETNLINTVEQGVNLLGTLDTTNVKLLLDLFHMNIEERDMAESIRQAGNAVGHVHLADSNRRAAGWGHLDYAPIMRALKEIGYNGYISGEVFPLPDSSAAAAQTIKAFKELTR